MTAFLLDLDQSFHDLSKSVKTLHGGLKDLDTSFDKITKAGETTTKTFKDGSKALEKFAASGKLLGGVALGLLAVADAATKLKALAEVGEAGYEAWKKFKGVEETLTFSTAITGTTQLADNFKMLEQVADNAFNRIAIAGKAIFNTDEFNKWSSTAVAAYAQVEQAAYRLATVTTAANERSIDKVEENIKATRDLQKATNDALGSVELLNTQYDIASAGFTSKKDNLNVGKAAVNLSQAGFGEVAGSTNAIVRALRALGDSSTDADKRAAQLFETTRVGLLTLNQLTPEVGTLAVSSKNLGLEFSEVSAALAGLTTQGISASEASTRLQAFFGEVVQGSQQANQYLSQFKDEMGKPIQLNASALKEKGIGGIIADLKKATGGNQAALQQIFGRQESVEAVQLLSNLGQKNLKEYQGRIEGASGDRLDDEAKNRQKTITGAFQQAANSSQKQVENFGQGLAPSVIDKLAETNEVMGTLLTTSAEGIGKLAGGLSGLATKVKALGGFFLSAFTAVAPFAFFAVVAHGIQGLGAKFKQLQKEGESPWATIQRLANEFIANTEAKFINFLKKVRDELTKVKEEIRGGIADAQNEPQQLSLFGGSQDASKVKTQQDKAESVPQSAIQNVAGKEAVQLELIDPKDKFSKARQDTVAALNQTKQSVLTSAEKTREKLVQGSQQAKTVLDKAGKDVKDKLVEGAQQVKKAIGDENLAKLGNLKTKIGDFGNSLKTGVSDLVGNLFSGKRGLAKKGAGALAGVGDFLAGGKLELPNVGGALKGVGNLGSKIGVLAQGGLKAAAPLLGSIGKYMLGLGLAGTAAGIGIAVVSGWSNTLFNSLNKKAIPAVQEMRESLLDLKNVSGLEDLLKSLDPIAGKADSASYEMNVLNETIYRGQKLWNDLTGATANYFNNVLPQIEEADGLIQKSLNKNLEDAKKGRFGAESDAGQTAENKLNRGINLSQDDYKALEDETNDRKKKADARVELQRKKIKEGEGKYSPEEMEAEKNKLRQLEAETKEIKKQLDLQLKQIKLNEAVKKLKAVDTTVPLQLQISDQNEQSIGSQIKSISEKFKKGLEGTLNDPAAFEKLGTEVENAIGSIETQVEIDPQSAAKLRDDLRASIPDFDKLLFSNPQLRQKAAALNQKITESTVKQAQTQETSDTAVYGQAQSLGSQSTLIAQAKYEAQTKSINTQVKALNEELTKPETSLARQKEILAQIEQLEGQRAQLAADNRIAQELGVRKQTLSLTEQLLDVDRARINLFSQESKFGSLAVTAAEAKLQAAKQELALKKEQISIGNKEDIIKKEEIVKAIQAKADRDKSEKDRATGGKSEGELTSAAEQKKADRTAQGQKEIEAVKADTQRKIEELKKTPISFDKNEMAKLQEVNAGNLTDEAGNFKGNAAKAQEQLNEQAKTYEAMGDLTSAMKSREAAELINKKDTEQRIKIKETEKSGKTQIENINKQVESDNQRTDRLSNKQIQQGKDLGQKEDTTRNAAGGSADTNKEQELPDKKGGTGTGTSAQDDLNFSKMLAEVKERLGSFNEQIAVSEAEIAKEFAQREKLIKRGELLGESFSQIANSGAIFANSVAAASLTLSGIQLTNKKGRLDKEADEEIAKINSKVKLLAQNAAAAEEAASKGRQLGVNPEAQKQLDEQAGNARELANKAKSESGDDIKFVKVKTALDKIAAGLEEAEAKIKDEFAVRTRLIEITESLGGAFSNLASTASSLFSNSSLGATLNRFAAEITAGSGKAQKEFEEQNRLVEERNKALNEAVNKARQAGADSETIDKLQKAADKDTAQKPVEQAYLRQKLVLDTLNERLSVMAARVNEVTDALNKRGGLSKDTIDFEQRKKDLAGETNRSGRGLQNSLIGAFAKNNPFAELLQKRNDFAQAADEGKLQKSKNVTEAKKEIIDLTIQKQQLILEQQSYENALTQTQLLSDMVNLQQGKEAKFSNTQDVQSRLNQLPALIENSRQVAAERLDLVQQKLDYVPKELEQKNANVDRDTYSKQLGIVSQNGQLDPSMLPELKQVLANSTQSLSQYKRQDINVGSLRDSSFQVDLQRMNALSSTLNPNFGLGRNVLQSQAQRTADQYQQTRQQQVQPPTIQAPISINLNITGSDANNFNKNLEQNMKQYVSKQVQDALGQLGKQLVTTSKKV